MTKHLRIALTTLVLVLAVSAAHAQNAPVRFDFSQAAVGKPGSSDDATVYSFEATTGEKVTFELVGAGHLGLTLYAPDGSRMLQTDGVDEVSLAAYIPRTAAYLLAVHRSDPSSQYMLSGQQVTSDLQTVLLALGVGLYPPDDPSHHSCWVDPGHIRRDYYSGGYEDATIGRDGWFSVQGKWDKPVADPSYRRRVVVDAGQVIITNYYAGGEKVFKVPVVELIAPQRHPERYRSYLCTD